MSAASTSFFASPSLEIESLRAEVAMLREQIEVLRALQDGYYERFSGDILDHGQRLKKLEIVEPQPLQRDRGDLLRALLAANGGKMLAKDARQKMHLSRSVFSQLLSTARDEIEVRPYHLKKNQKVLLLKSCLAKQ